MLGSGCAVAAGVAELVVAGDERGVVGVQGSVPGLQGGVVGVQVGVVGFQAEDAGDAGQVDAFVDEGGDAAEPGDVGVAVAAGAAGGADGLQEPSRGRSPRSEGPVGGGW